MQSDNKKYPAEQIVKHQTLLGALLLIAWFSLNMVVLATTSLMEYRRDGREIPVWEPFCWEISSALWLLLLIPLGIFINDKWLAHLSLKIRLLLHVLLTLPFSAVHVVGMVSIRKLWYQAMGSEYHFGNLPVEFLYEYRKDAQAYLTIALVIYGYRFIMRRLQGEASYIAEGETAEALAPINMEPEAPPERLLIKKLGREFLIQTANVEWIEASGNYANLHIRNSVYPMRITMEKLEQKLPAQFTRIHRSTIVNLTQVREIQPLDTGDYQIVLHAGKTLVLSRRYRDGFKTRLSID